MYSMVVAVTVHAAVRCKIAKQSRALLLACGLNPTIKHISSRT